MGFARWNHLQESKPASLRSTRCLKRSGVLPRDLCSVFCCFIPPVVEYACPVWHSSLSNALFDKLEQIQKRATKIMLPGLSYRDRLAHLKLPILEERRDELCRRFYKTIMRPEDKINDVLPPITESVYSFRNAPKIPPEYSLSPMQLRNGTRVTLISADIVYIYSKFHMNFISFISL